MPDDPVAMTAGMFSVVINHFAPAPGTYPLEASTLFCATLCAAAPDVASVVVVDGSAEANADLARLLETRGVRYHHAGRRLSFAEGYNAGLALSETRWTVLCASDVYPSLTIFATLARYCASADTTHLGCIIPWLSHSDFAAQRGSHRVSRAVTVPLMTFNFNVFETDYLRSLGGVPEEFGGYYNDAVLAHRMFLDGRDIVLLPDHCVHYGSLTVRTPGNTLSFDRDAAAFRAAYPRLWSQGSLWHIDLRAFSRSRSIALLMRVARLVPERRRWSFVDRCLQIATTLRSR